VPPNPPRSRSLTWTLASDVYDLYAILSGGTHLAWDGNDGIMHSIWNPSFISCPNATWNGSSTNYCDGVATDDIVSHEWAHAYTETTHGLIYQWQPGALNESYSDIFGGSPPPLCDVTSPAAIVGGYGAAGASAMIVVNHSGDPFNMSGGGSLSIPSIMISTDDGNTIKAQLGVGVESTVSISASDANTVRWLSG